MEMIQLKVFSKVPGYIRKHSKATRTLFHFRDQDYVQEGGLFVLVQCRQLLPIMRHYVKLWKWHLREQISVQDEPMVC